MNGFEIAVVAALGVGCVALVTAAAMRARTRRGAAAAPEAEPRPGRRAPINFEEDPIVAALGVGGDIPDGRQARPIPRGADRPARRNP